MKRRSLLSNRSSKTVKSNKSVDSKITEASQEKDEFARTLIEEVGQKQGLFNKMNNVGKKFRDLDMYGRNIQLTYRGSDKFKTKFGAFCTLLAVIFMIIYVAAKAQVLVDPDFVMHIESKVSLENLYQIYQG